MLLSPNKILKLYKRSQLLHINMSSFASADVAVEALRKKMIDAKLDIFLIPASDAHGSEYVSKVDERRAFISNFNGSAGLAAVVASPTDERRKSSLFTDSRYKLQSQKQLSSQWNVYISGEKNSPKLSEWLLNFKASTTIGFDPRYSSISTVTNWKKELNESNNISLVEILDSPVDAVWEEMGKEKPTIHPIWPLSDDLSGASTASKIESLRKTMKEKRTRIAVVSALDDVAWLLNLRGGDIPYTPLFISYCVVSEKDVTLLVDIEKLSKDALHFLKESNVSIEPYENIKQVLESMSSSDATTDTTTTPISIWLDPLSANWHLKSICQNLGLKIFSKSTLPISLSKAIKNSIEIHSIQEAHIVDGVALCKYFHWLEETMKEAVIQAKESKNEEWNGELQLDEVDAADQLYQFRKETSPSFIGNSFSTISSSGPNGAIVHYEPTPGNCRKLNVNELYLCDSGGQYISPHLGTTDVTRCYKHSEPTHLEKSCYTRVLQGHIDLSSAIFPPGTEGHKLDIIARLPLFSIGKNYGHGTGHGVGHCSVVHEGPHGIGTKKRNFDEALQIGMITSIEPGYYSYKDGFGIRIENLAYVVPVEENDGGNSGDDKYMTFQHLTMCPIETKLIDLNVMTEKQIEWLNNYHLDVRKVLSPRLKNNKQLLEWLIKKTEPIGAGQNKIEGKL